MPATVGRFTSSALEYCSFSSANSDAYALKNKCNLKNNAIFKQSIIHFRKEPNRRLYVCTLTPVQEILNQMLDMLNLSLHTSPLLFVQLQEVCLSSLKYIKIGIFFLKGRYGFSELLFSICCCPAGVTASINSTGREDRR